MPEPTIGNTVGTMGRGSSPALLFSISVHPCSEAVPVLHQFPVGVLVEYLVAAKLVEVAAAIVEFLAVDAGAGRRSPRHGQDIRVESSHSRARHRRSATASVAQ